MDTYKYKRLWKKIRKWFRYSPPKRCKPTHNRITVFMSSLPEPVVMITPITKGKGAFVRFKRKYHTGKPHIRFRYWSGREVIINCKYITSYEIDQISREDKHSGNKTTS